MNTPEDVARIAAAQMGAPQPQAAPQPATTQPQPPKDTAQDKAATKASPDTEGDKSAQDAVVYKIPMGETTRDMTPQQIASTLERYGALNYQHAQMKPILSAIDKIRQANPNMTPQELMAKIEDIAKAGEKNATVNDGQKTPPPNSAPQAGKSNEDIAAQLKAWEEENAATLPPGYADMMSQLSEGGPAFQQMQQQMQQMQQMMRAVLNQAGGVAGAAQQGMQQAQGQRIEATKRQIANNIDRVQSALQIPDERAQDFMVFAAERGYTLEDFIDPELTIRVMQDFRNQMDSPEMQRMRDIAQRRQAYTGSMGSSPSSGAPGTGPQPSEAGVTFDGLASKVMQQRGLA